MQTVRFYVRWWQAASYIASHPLEIVGGGACMAAGFVVWLFTYRLFGPAVDNVKLDLGQGVVESSASTVLYIVGAFAFLYGPRIALGKVYRDWMGLGMTVMVALLGVVFLALGAASHADQNAPGLLRYMILNFAGYGLLFALLGATAMEWSDRQLGRLDQRLRTLLEARGILQPEAVAQEKRAARRARTKRLKPYMPRDYKRGEFFTLAMDLAFPGVALFVLGGLPMSVAVPMVLGGWFGFTLSIIPWAFRFERNAIREAERREAEALRML